MLFRRMVVGGIAALGVLFSAVATAGAADDVNSYQPVTAVERLPNAAEFTDHSGVALTPSGAILTVDNGEDTINEYLPDPNGPGWLRGRIFYLGEKCEGEGEEQVCTSPISDPIYDLEDITWMGGDRYGLIDEWDNTLSVIRIPDEGTRVTEIYSLDLWRWVDHFAGNGIEGLAYSFDESVPGTDTFYVASEANALLVRLDFDSNSGAFKFRGPDIRLQIPTASAVHDVQGDDTFYVVSNRGRSLHRFDKSGVELSPPRPLTFNNPEGLTMSPDLSRMIVVGESFGGNQIQEFAPGAPAGTQTSFARIATGADDATEANGTVTTSGVLNLGADGTNVVGLRFTGICLPSNANIASADLALFSAGANFSPSELTVRGVRGPDAGPFINGVGNNISGRTSTVRSVSAETGGWGTPWREYLPDLAPVITELLGQPDRGDCDPITLKLDGTGLRTAFNQEVDPARAASLVITWSNGPTPTPLGVSVTSSCLAGRGRVDVTVANPTPAAQSALVSLSGLPQRAIAVPASGEATSTFTGRNNGRYLVEVRSNNAVNSNELVVATCQVPVTVQNSCLSDNGLFRVRVRNTADVAGTIAVQIGQIVRSSTIEPYGTRMFGVSGRADGEYAVAVTQQLNGSPGAEVIFQEAFAVACDPPPPLAETTITLSCLLDNGLVSIVLFNNTGADADYTIRFSSLADRVRSLAPGAIERVPISGRPDGFHSLTILRNNRPIRQVTMVIACDQAGR